MGRSSKPQRPDLASSKQQEHSLRVTDVLLEHDHHPQVMLAEGKSGAACICMLVQYLGDGPRYACRLISSGLRAELTAGQFELRTVFEGAEDIRAAEVGYAPGTLELNGLIDRFEMSSLLPCAGLTFPGLHR